MIKVIDHSVSKITLRNELGMELELINYGAMLWSVKTPDEKGKIEEVTLNYQENESTFNSYVKKKTYYMGGTIGRYANRIKDGKFIVDEKEYNLNCNNGPNALHGGAVGWDKRNWDFEVSEFEDYSQVKFSLISKNMEEGYPGTVMASSIYQLSKHKNEFKTILSAVTDQTTIINMCNHAYWNLSGNIKNKILNHELCLPTSTKYLPVDSVQIPTGEMKSVDGTHFDFTSPRIVGESIMEVDGGGQPGYDHCFVFDSSRSGSDSIPLVAILRDLVSKREMKMYSNSPGLQLYTSNWILDEGKYTQHSALCLETQMFPNSPNEKSFPSTLLKTGEEFKQITTYVFSNL